MANLISDTHLRSWTKSITWRIIGIVILGVLAWLVTGNWGQTTVITLTFHVIRFVLYYFHERAWERIGWGRKRVKEDYVI